MISVENVSKNYGDARALHSVSFEVKKGEVLGLLGPNGAGKTTLMRILTGFFPPTEGRVTVGGIDMAKEPKKAKRKIGYLPERISLYPDYRVEDVLHFVAEVRCLVPRERVREVEEKMARCGISSVRQKLIGHLSKGYLQRVGLAQALVGDPEVLILDEPTNGLDPKQIIEIRELIRELGRERTLILSTHILPEAARLAERVLILNQGRIVAQGRPSELERNLLDRQEILVRVGKITVGAGLPRPWLEGAGSAPLEAVLGSISGVESLEKISEEDSTVTYLLRTLPEKDLRPEVARRLIETGYALVELSAKTLGLEDIFLRLVTEEAAPLKPVDSAVIGAARPRTRQKTPAANVGMTGRSSLPTMPCAMTKL